MSPQEGRCEVENHEMLQGEEPSRHVGRSAWRKEGPKISVFLLLEVVGTEVGLSFLGHEKTDLRTLQCYLQTGFSL